jgi:hypothetical protein
MLLVVSAALSADIGLRAGYVLSTLRSGLLPRPASVCATRLLSNARRVPTDRRTCCRRMEPDLQSPDGLLPVSGLPVGK